MSFLPLLILRHGGRGSFLRCSGQLPQLRCTSTAPYLKPEPPPPTDPSYNPPPKTSGEVTVRSNEQAALSLEDLEIQALIKKIATATDLESPRLYASFDVGKPLFGELAPIRKREHKWVPPMQARNSEMYKMAEHQRPTTNMMAFLQRKRDFTLRGARLWAKRSELANMRKDQTYSIERVGVLGPELAAAHFFVMRGAKVKFHTVDRWFDKDSYHHMPARHMESAHLEAIDATGLPLLYEGMDHFIGLRSLKYLSLKNCKKIDDWCLPKLYILNQTLEFLDLSGCDRVSERGLSCLYHLSGLRNLVIADMPKVQNKELVALLLEDELPLCEIEGVAYNEPPPVYISPREQSILEEDELVKKGIPLLHRVAHPDYVEVGNKAYNSAYEEQRKPKEQPLAFNAPVPEPGQT